MTLASNSENRAYVVPAGIDDRGTHVASGAVGSERVVRIVGDRAAVVAAGTRPRAVAVNGPV